MATLSSSDVYSTIDWKNWTFTEQTSTTWSPQQPIKSDPLTHRLKKFDLNEMPALSHPDVCIIDNEEPEQYASQSEGIAAASPVVLISYPEASDKAEVVVSLNFSFWSVVFRFLEPFMTKGSFPALFLGL